MGKDALLARMQADGLDPEHFTRSNQDPKARGQNMAKARVQGTNFRELKRRLQEAKQKLHDLRMEQQQRESFAAQSVLPTLERDESLKTPVSPDTIWDEVEKECKRTET